MAIPLNFRVDDQRKNRTARPFLRLKVRWLRELAGSENNLKEGRIEDTGKRRDRISLYQKVELNEGKTLGEGQK